MDLYAKLEEWNLNDKPITEQNIILKSHFQTKQQRAGEDRFQMCKILNNEVLYYGVFDGHGGSIPKNHIVDYCKENLHLRLEDVLSRINRDSFKFVADVISKCFLDFDTEMYNLKLSKGSCCCLLLIDLKYNKCFIVNLGDSRCIVFKKDGEIVFETKDHTPISEKKRIDALGITKITIDGKKGDFESSFLSNPNIGGIRVSRAFGDFKFKETKNLRYHHSEGSVISAPTIDCLDFKYDLCFVLSTDGPFDMSSRLTSQEFIDNYFVAKQPSIQQQVENAIQLVSKRTNDDITIGAITFM